MFNHRTSLLFLPYLALVLNAAVWGTSWWPLREMQADGLHPLWASAATYLLGSVVIVSLKPAIFFEFFENKALWILALAAGSTMVGFNWGVAIGEVIRVVLLFYLMPIWAVVFARLILGEAITVRSLGRILLALAGAVLVLSPEGSVGVPVPRELAEWLGLFGGACFALNNVMLRHQQHRTEQARLFGMFVGGIVVPVAVAVVLSLVLGGNGSTEEAGLIAWPVVPSAWGLFVLLVFSVLLVGANYGLQYGAARLPANITAVVMLSEVVFATLSAIWLTDEVLTLQTALGGLTIFLAAGLSALDDAKAADL